MNRHQRHEATLIVSGFGWDVCINDRIIGHIQRNTRRTQSWMFKNDAGAFGSVRLRVEAINALMELA
jgi:hypothetical protein